MAKKKKKPTPQPRSTMLSVVLHRQLVTDYHEGVEYGAWERRWINNFGGVTLLRNDECSRGEVVPVAFPVKPGDTVYVLWAEYSSGDSFGHEEGCTDIIAVFADSTTAIKARQAIKTKVELLRDCHKWDPHVNLSMNGTTTLLNYYMPFTGYFESLDTLHVTPATVQLNDE